MKLIKFQIKNYCSIIDSGVIELSKNDNVSVFAGQNESGKSSILRALNDFEEGKFNPDSIPFSTGEKPFQAVSCTYLIEDDDDIVDILTDVVVDSYDLKIEDDEKVLDENKIKKIKEFTITKTNINNEVKNEIDENSFQIFKNSILEKPRTAESAEENIKEASENQENKTEETAEQPEKYLDIKDEQNSDIANLFWQSAPKIVFFDDFCDLLPNKIFISALKDKKTETEGYRAVRNLEQILETNFVSKDEENDSVRRTKEDEENEFLSVDFQNDWGQRIHGENQVVVKYDFQKRDGEGESGSYINFYVETKKGQPLPPKQRSKGLIWFLSLWLELKARDIEHNDLVLLLDEPDQHLHVKAQKDILKLINKLSGKIDGEGKLNKIKGDQILYSTHSPYLIEIDFLNRIKLVLNTENDGTKIEDITTSKIDTEYKKDALQPISNAIGFNVSEFSPLNNKNVILEGVSDYYYFLGMKKILKKSNNYSFIPGIGVRKINNLISFSIGYGLDWLAVIDDDPKKGGKDSKNKFNEIKDFIFDRDEEKTKEKVYILDKIVGIENMFTMNDLKLIDPTVKQDSDKVKVVGAKRKILFGKLFFEKVKNDEIKEKNLSKTAKDNFNKAFDFIESHFGVK